MFDLNFIADSNFSPFVEKAFKWIELNTIRNKGIIVCSNSEELLPYPEVTGYYIQLF